MTAYPFWKKDDPLRKFCDSDSTPLSEILTPENAESDQDGAEVQNDS